MPRQREVLMPSPDAVGGGSSRDAMGGSSRDTVIDSSRDAG